MRRHALDEPEQHREPSWSLIRLVAPTGTTKKRPIASDQRERDRRAPGEPPDLGSPRPRARSGVGRDARARGSRSSATRQAPRPPGSPASGTPGVASAQATSGLRAHIDLAIGLADRHRPGGDAAHHHALEDRLAAHGSVAVGDRRPSGIRCSASCGRPFSSGEPPWALRGRCTPSPATGVPS